jgi:hypothetical protein
MFTTGALIIICIQVFAFVCAVVTIVQTLRNKAAIEEVHTLVNSRLTELLELTKVAATAAGRLEGAASSRQGGEVK